MSDNAIDSNDSSSLDNRIFTSISQCANATGYTFKVIKEAKRLGFPGFTQSNRIVWAELKPALESNKQIVDNLTEDNIEFYKKEIAKRDVVLRDLQIQKIKEEMLSPEELNKFLVGFGTLLSSVLKKKRQDLISKCVGYEAVVDKEFVDIFTLVTKELDSIKV